MRKLSEMTVGECAMVVKINEKGSIRRRLMDIGLVPGTTVRCLGKSPLGDPSAYLVRGAVIALRSENCAQILIN